MLGSLRRMSGELDAVVRDLVVAELSAVQAAEWLRAAAAVERRAAVIKTLVAQRAVDGGIWASGGYRSPESWLGDQTGAGFGDARATLRASQKLEELPGFEAAARNGELSEQAMKELGDAATRENEQDLLGTARRGNHDQLRKKCRQEKAKSRSNDDERARADKAHRERFFRSWTDHEGAWRFEGKAPAMIGAQFEAALARAADTVFKHAWKQGRRESAAAYTLDALVALVTNGGATAARPAARDTVVVRVDASRLAGGEGMCEAATGAVPVDDAIGQMLAGAFVKIVVTEGVDVTKVKHLGTRSVPAILRTAVMERDNHACVHCGSKHRLELHHYNVDFARGGATSYGNLCTLCWHCHALVTDRGFAIRGSPGAWEWSAPEERAG